jgi:hypothetical protein
MKRLAPLLLALLLPFHGTADDAVPEGFSEARLIETAHFRIHHEAPYAPVGVTGLMEGLHAKLMLDLQEFAPWARTEKADVYVYADAGSYVRRTKIPAWSAAYAVPEKRQIHCYESPHLQRILAHEMSHLLFTPFFQEKGSDPPAWLGEGVAKVMEFNYGQEDQTNRMNRHSFSREAPALDLVFAFDYHHSPADSRDINQWYEQSASVTAYLMRRLPRPSFIRFCDALRDGKTTDQALQAAYGFQVPDVTALERLWRDSLVEK